MGKRQRRAVEHANVVQPEKAAREDVLPLRILPVHPPGKIQEQLVKGTLQKGRVAFVQPVAHLVHAPHSPHVDGRVHVVECEFVGGNLPVWV
jgi:hypothetical protein